LFAGCQVLQGARQVAANGAAQATRLQKDDIFVHGLDQVVIKPGLAKLIHDDSDPWSVCIS